MGGDAAVPDGGHTEWHPHGPAGHGTFLFSTQFDIVLTVLLRHEIAVLYLSTTAGNVASSFPGPTQASLLPVGFSSSPERPPQGNEKGGAKTHRVFGLFAQVATCGGGRSSCAH